MHITIFSVNIPGNVGGCQICEPLKAAKRSIFLFVVEIAWFIALPLWSELKLWPTVWRQGRHTGWRALFKANPRARRSAWLVLLLLVLLVLPWTEGSPVQTGQTLLTLASPELELRWRRAQSRVERARWQASAAGVSAEQRQHLQVLQEESATAQVELASVQADMALFAPIAPFNGILRDLHPDLKPGVWVGNRERLATLVRPGRWHVETYLDEDAVRRIAVCDTARFFTDGLEGPVLTLTVSAIDRDASRTLPNGQLASQFGGTVMVREKHGQLVPERAVYRVTLQGTHDVGSLAQQSWRGHVVIHGRWEAPGASFLRAALVVVWRELGF